MYQAALFIHGVIGHVANPHAINAALNSTPAFAFEFVHRIIKRSRSAVSCDCWIFQSSISINPLPSYTFPACTPVSASTSSKFPTPKYIAELTACSYNSIPLHETVASDGTGLSAFGGEVIAPAFLFTICLTIMIFYPAGLQILSVEGFSMIVVTFISCLVIERINSNREMSRRIGVFLLGRFYRKEDRRFREKLKSRQNAESFTDTERPLAYIYEKIMNDGDRRQVDKMELRARRHFNFIIATLLLLVLDVAFIILYLGIGVNLVVERFLWNALGSLLALFVLMTSYYSFGDTLKELTAIYLQCVMRGQNDCEGISRIDCEGTRN
jgi:hypothetical protein